MTEIISIRMIVAIFFFAYWLMYDKIPFNIWWLILIIAIDWIISIILIAIIGAVKNRIWWWNAKQDIVEEKVKFYWMDIVSVAQRKKDKVFQGGEKETRLNGNKKINVKNSNRKHKGNPA